MLLLSCLDIRLLAEASYAADNSYISDVVFWDTPNARAEREYGFDPANHGTYEVCIGDNARSVKMRVSAADFQEDNVYCQMTIGETASDPVKLISGAVSEIVAPVSSELTGSTFRLGDRKEGNLVVGQYDPETGAWGSGKTGYSFSFMRRVVLNSVSMQDQDGNRLTMDPAAIDPNTDKYTISIPETSETIKFTPTLTIKSTVRDEEDSDGTLYKKTISYDVPGGALISQGDAAVFEVSKLDTEDGRPYITADVGYSKGNSDIITSSYRFYLDGYEVIPEEDHTPDAVIMESDKEITCDKDEDIDLRVSAQVSGEANLSYQWFEGSSEGSVTTRIEGAGNSSYHPETKYARTKYYRCCVTNNVNGKKYIKYSGVFKVTVRCSYVTPPEIYELTEDQEIMAGSSVVFDINTYFFDWDGDSWHEPEYVWFINNNASTEGSDVLELEPILQFPGSHGTYQFNNVGIYYVYCVATATIGDKTGSTTSDFIKITVKEPEGLDEFSGDGTKESPYIINSVNVLEKIKSILATGYYFKDKYFKLIKDITLPVDWIPVGALAAGESDDELGINIRPFSGTVDGDGHTVTIAEGGKPLFGYVREASVKNLKIYGSRIDGYGLVDNYVVDYGTDGNSDTGVPATCNIENVTILSGSSILKSGFIGGVASGANTVNIKNCTVQSGVTIGYDKTESNIGSFAGELNGTITNSSSAAAVFGVDNVGGFAGRKGQSMGPCSFTNCEFTGGINATGDRVGGILGSGYYSSNHSAPNAPVVVINNCYVVSDITGVDHLGGILGTEPEVEQCWGNGTGGVQNSFYYGKITATGTTVGGIIGYYNSLDKYQTIANNFYLETSGATKGIGKLKKVITAAESSQYGREDDFDAEKACSATSAESFADGTVLAKLNSGEGSYQNWRQDEKYPVFGEEAVPVELSVSRYIEEYLIGDTFDTFGMEITVRYSDGSVKNVDPSEVQFSGFDSVTVGQKTITATYGPVSTTFKVRVIYDNPPEILVKLIIIGDTVHGSASEVHTLKGGGLKKWLDKNVIITMNMSVYDLLEKGLEDLNVDHKSSFSTQYDSVYVSGVQIPGSDDYLEEFSNGSLSGWMYHVNGYYPDKGVDKYYLEDGDVVVFHYTDDYTQEEAIGADGAGYGEDLEFYPPKDDPDEDAKKELEQAKTVAKAGLSNYKSFDDYRSEEQASLASIIENGIAAIDTATTLDKVQTELNKAKSLIDALKTKAQYEAEEQGQGGEQDDPAAKALAEAKTNAKMALDLYMAPSEYREAEKALLLEIQTQGKAAIDAAETEEAVKALLTEYKGKIDKLKTIAQYEAEEELARKVKTAAIKKAKAAKTTVSVKSLTKHRAKVTWKKVTLSYIVDGKKYSRAVTGYKVYRATKKAGKYKLIKTVKKAKTLKYTDKKLKKGRQYYYKVRTYTKIDSKNYSGKWSAVKKVKGR